MLKALFWLEAKTIKMSTSQLIYCAMSTYIRTLAYICVRIDEQLGPSSSILSGRINDCILKCITNSPRIVAI